MISVFVWNYVKFCYSCQVQSFYWRLGDDNKYPCCNNLYFYCYLEQKITYVHILGGDNYWFIHKFVLHRKGNHTHTHTHRTLTSDWLNCWLAEATLAPISSDNRNYLFQFTQQILPGQSSKFVQLSWRHLRFHSITLRVILVRYNKVIWKSQLPPHVTGVQALDQYSDWAGLTFVNFVDCIEWMQTQAMLL